MNKQEMGFGKPEIQPTEKEKFDALFANYHPNSPNTGIDYDLAKSHFDEKIVASQRERINKGFVYNWNDNLSYANFENDFYRYIKCLGFNNIAEEDIEKREEEISKFKEIMSEEKYKNLITKFKNLDEYFDDLQKSTLKAQEKTPSCVLHMLVAFVNDPVSQIKDKIELRIALGKLGLADEFNDSEMNNATESIKNRVQYLIENSVKYIIEHPSEDENYIKHNIETVCYAISKLCKQFNISTHTLSMDLEALKKIASENNVGEEDMEILNELN